MITFTDICCIYGHFSDFLSTFKRLCELAINVFQEMVRVTFFVCLFLFVIMHCLLFSLFLLSCQDTSLLLMIYVDIL